MNHSADFRKVNETVSSMDWTLAFIQSTPIATFSRPFVLQIRKQLSALRAKGYYGDGFWSSGKLLQYGEISKPFDPAEEPAFTWCLLLAVSLPRHVLTRVNRSGGAVPKRRRRLRTGGGSGITTVRGVAKPGKTGRQTAIPPKAGGRVKRKGAFGGEGQVMDGAPEMSTFK